MKLLIDSNVWRYIVDAHAQGVFLLVANDPKLEIQVAPSVLFETLRLGNPELRAKIVRLLTKPVLMRLMPEAYSESMELLDAIRTLRPEFLRMSPDLASFEKLKTEWARRSGGNWRMSARFPSKAAANLQRGEAKSEALEGAKERPFELRKEMLRNQVQMPPSLNGLRASLDRPIPGWKGDEVDLWRMERWRDFSRTLAFPRQAYRDWLSPFVHLDDGLLHSAEWTKFWFYDLDAKMVPRQWLRWAHTFIQRFKKPTSGSAGDAQFFSYFVETELVVTADKALIDILDLCRPEAPVPLPASKILRAGKPGVDELLELMTSLTSPDT